nr:MAG TPA: hypothetical protein [Caudoviricetes sp.]
MNFKRWLDYWGTEITFSIIFIITALFFIIAVWQSETYKNGGFIKDDTVWYSATIVIHYADKADRVNIRTCRVPSIRVGRGWNSLTYTDSLGYHCIKSIAPIEIVNIVKEK